MDPEIFDIGGDDAAIDAAFAEAFGRETDTQAPTDEVTPGEEPAADEEGQARDDAGRFARTTPEVTDLEGEQAAHEQELAPEEEPAEQADPDVAAFLAKYGNDPDAALRAAVELDRLRGRQGDELGQLRSELQQLRQHVERPAAPAVPITEQVVEDLDNLAVEDPRAALSRAATMDPSGQLTERVMDVWFATNPRQASAFQSALISQETERRVRAELQPITDERSVTAEERAYVDAWNIAASHQPKLNDLANEMKDVLESRPSLAKAVLSAETPEERAELFLSTYELAAAKTGTVDPAVREEAERQASETARTARTRAKVVKPSAVGSLPGAGKEEQTEEDRIKAGILGAKSSDILSGFTTE